MFPSCVRIAAGEVPEVVDRQRDVRSERLADRLAVLPRLQDRDLLEGSARRSATAPTGRPPGQWSRWPPMKGKARWPAVDGQVDVIDGRACVLGDRQAGGGREVVA